MCLEIGSKVAVLDEAISGVVTRVKGDDVFLKTEDGMEYFYKTSDLVKINIDQNELLKTTKVKGSFLKEKLNHKQNSKKTLFKKINNEVVMEVDLHAEKLVKSTKGMDNFDVLNLQIDTARFKLEYCMKKRISKVIFIHGVGEGVLKAELYNLFNKYSVRYYDAAYQKYGLGATEVYIFQNS